MHVSNGYVLDESPSRLGRLEPTPMGERTDRGALWERLRRDGYLYLTQHLDPEFVWDFRRYYFATLAETGLTDPRADPREGIAGDGPLDRGAYRRILYDDIVPGDRYQELCAAPAIRDFFAWLFDDEIHLHRRKIIRHTLPGEAGIGTATQAHYDLVYLREGSDRVLSMWIPLGDTPIDRGGLAYLERSHHRVLAEEASGTLRRPAASITADLPGLAEQYDSRWLLADYAAGDVMVHSAHIIHAGLDNTDQHGRMRLSTDIRYQRVSDPIDWRWQEHWRWDDGL